MSVFSDDVLLILFVVLSDAVPERVCSIPWLSDLAPCDRLATNSDRVENNNRRACEFVNFTFRPNMVQGSVA